MQLLGVLYGIVAPFLVTSWNSKVLCLLPPAPVSACRARRATAPTAPSALAMSSAAPESTLVLHAYKVIF